MTAYDCSQWVVGDGHGTSWATMHCGQLALAVLQAMGHTVKDEDLWVGQDVGRGVERLDSYLAAHGAKWLRLGNTAAACSEVGDVIVSAAPVGPAPIHLSVYVDTVARKAITTTEGTGACLVPVWSFQLVRGVYRWQGAN